MHALCEPWARAEELAVHLDARAVGAGGEGGGGLLDHGLQRTQCTRTTVRKVPDMQRGVGVLCEPWGFTAACAA